MMKPSEVTDAVNYLMHANESLVYEIALENVKIVMTKKIFSI